MILEYILDKERVME